MTGTIHDKNTLFVVLHVGEGGNNGVYYELLSSARGSAPMVRSKTTGKYFSLSWDEIVKLAVEAGIDKEEDDAVDGGIKYCSE